MKTDTLVAGLDGWTDPATGGLVPPLQSSVTHAAAPGLPASGYARSGRAAPTPLEGLLAALDDGARALAFASGASAAQAALALVPAGGRLLLEADGYYEFRGILDRAAATRGFALEPVDTTDLAAVSAALAAGDVSLIWTECPGNPKWQVPDLAALARLAHAAGARLLVDATVPTPFHLQPLALGADIVLHSATKFLNGHGDLMAGALILAEDAPVPALIQARTDAGSILSPHAEWLLLRGLRTLAVRMERASGSALALAGWLESRPEVTQVLYPGLPSHGRHDLARAQFRRGFGAMLSFRMGTQARAEALAARLGLIRRATSLGSTETLIERRAGTEGPGSQCPDDLLRLSVGLEALDDLQADLEQALDGLAGPAQL